MKRDLGKIVDVLYGVGFILAFAGGWFKWLVPYASFGTLLIIIGAGISLYNQFKR